MCGDVIINNLCNKFEVTWSILVVINVVVEVANVHNILWLLKGQQLVKWVFNEVKAMRKAEAMYLSS